MKLFAVNRFAGENAPKKKAGCIDKEKEKERLAELLSKVQKRRENLKKSKELQKQQAAQAKIERKLEKSIKVEKKETKVKDEAASSDSSEEEEHTETVEEKAEDVPVKRPRLSSESGQPEGFTVIGKDHYRRVKEAKAVLPRWLAQPTVISVNMKQEQTKIDDINLVPFLKEKLISEGVNCLFPVQSTVIPWLLQEYRNSMTGYWPRDICVSAPTGSGKTLAFALPVIQALKPRLVREIRALVVLPVQDLAKQVFGVFRTYCESTGLKVVLATGQGPLQNEQRQLVLHDACGYRAMADIVVTTPGRLVHHLRDTPGLNLRHLRFLVVDEADRVMDGVQSDWLYHLDKHMAHDAGTNDVAALRQPCQAPGLTVANFLTCKPPPQKLLFSATLSQDPEKLAQLGLFQPKLFTCVVKHDAENSSNVDGEELRGDFVGKFAMPAEILEHYVLCEDEGAKPLLLHCLLLARAEENKVKKNRTLCFASSRLAAHRLALLLTALSNSGETPKVKVAEITAELRLSERNNILTKFANGEIDVIVSTDALARGIDIPDVDCVVSYDVPKQATLYIHRTGRTGRAGRAGTALTLLLPQQLPQFEHMIRTAGKHTTVNSMPAPLTQMEALEKEYLAALSSIKQIIKVEDDEALESSKVMKTTNKSKRKKISIKQKVKYAKKNLSASKGKFSMKSNIKRRKMGTIKKKKKNAKSSKVTKK